MPIADNHTYDLPVTQAEPGDAVGLSNVHVNRTLMELRADGLISFRNSTVTALDWERLKRACEFDAGYLHQDQVQITA